MTDQTNKTYSSLAETFDVVDVVDNTPRSQIDKQSVLPDVAPTTLEDDVTVVRNVLFNLLKQGEDAFEDLKRIAVAEESPRSFEVLNGMLSNISDIAVKLLDVHEKKAKIDKASASVDQPAAINNGVVNNNTVFVGTTTDLQDMIKKLNVSNQ